MKDRLVELDGMRGIAVLMVMFYHYLGRFPDFYPYDFNVSGVFEYGKLGVHLFFIISGFVISLTLTRSRSPIDFASKRLGRLLPPMVACSILTFTVMWSVDTPFTLFRRVGLEGFLPSWTFTRPLFWKLLFPNTEYVDGAYWSLFVEVRFYFWAAFFTFMPAFRKVPLTISATAFFVMTYVLWFAFEGLNLRYASAALNILFFPDYLYLFIAGIFFYDLFFNEKKAWKYVVLLASYSICLFQYESKAAVAVIALFYLLFLVFVEKRAWISALKLRLIVFAGAVSYATYLLHQNIGVTLLTLLPQGLGSATYILAFATVIVFMFFLGWLSYRYVERYSHWYAQLFSSVFAHRQAVDTSR